MRSLKLARCLKSFDVALIEKSAQTMIKKIQVANYVLLLSYKTFIYYA